MFVKELLGVVLEGDFGIVAKRNWLQIELCIRVVFMRSILIICCEINFFFGRA